MRPNLYTEFIMPHIIDVRRKVARFVRELRAKSGLTQAELAERAGMAQPDISRLEAGQTSIGPSVDRLERMAQACGRELVLGTRKRRQDGT